MGDLDTGGAVGLEEGITTYKLTICALNCTIVTWKIINTEARSLRLNIVIMQLFTTN